MQEIYGLDKKLSRYSGFLYSGLAVSAIPGLFSPEYTMKTQRSKIQQELTHDNTVSDLFHRKSNSGIIALEIKCRDKFVYSSERFVNSIFEMFKTEIKPQEDEYWKHDFMSGIRIPETSLSNTKTKNLHSS